MRELYRLPLPADRPVYLPYPAIRAELERCIASVRAALSAEAFETTWAEGQAMTLEAAVAEALEKQKTTASL